MRLFQLVILVGQLFHIHLAVWELPGQLSSDRKSVIKAVKQDDKLALLLEEKTTKSL